MEFGNCRNRRLAPLTDPVPRRRFQLGPMFLPASLLLLAGGVTAQIEGCEPPELPPPCAAPNDIVFVIDSSSSFRAVNIQQYIKAWLNNVVDEYAFDPTSTDSPRVSIVWFGGCSSCTVQDSVHVQTALIGDRDGVLTAAAAVPPDLGDQTCVSCGLETAIGLFDRPLSQSKRVIILLTDGVQTSGGTNAAAEAQANSFTAAGGLLYTVGAGSQLNADNLRQLSSDPDSLYSLNLATFEELEFSSQTVVQAVCDEVIKVCSLVYCDQPVSIEVYGRGFVDSLGLRCRVGGDDTAAFTYIDNSTLRCALSAPPTITAPGAGSSLSVEYRGFALEPPRTTLFSFLLRSHLLLTSNFEVARS